jgi:hypothetical protein
MQPLVTTMEMVVQVSCMLKIKMVMWSAHLGFDDNERILLFVHVLGVVAGVVVVVVVGIDVVVVGATKKQKKKLFDYEPTVKRRRNNSSQFNAKHGHIFTPTEHDRAAVIRHEHCAQSRPMSWQQK